MAAEAGLKEISPRALAPATDLLRRFGAGTCRDEAGDENSGLAAAEEVELGLGLSLGGRFGVENRLVRSSSIAAPSMTVGGGDDGLVMAAVDPIVRASSLPTEAEEDQRKRKGMQSLKRMEAKRRRLEKRDSRSRGKEEEDGGEGLGVQRDGARLELPGSAGGRPVSVPALVSHGSVGSQGSGSSGVSDIESRQEQELGISALSTSKEAGSHKVTTPLPLSHLKHRSRTPEVRGSSEEDGPSSNKIAAAVAAENGVKEPTVRRNVLEEMPCVSTCGDGPNGKRIQGFLYKYGRVGEDVRIVCVCHGSFLTPAEFVKHAGGGDVTNPLRHIVVSTSASALL